MTAFAKRRNCTNGFPFSPEVEAELVASGWIQIPSRAVADRPACPADLPQRGMLVTLAEIYARLERAKTDLTEIFLH